MQLLYDNVCERVKSLMNEDCINIDFSAVKHSISKLKAGNLNSFDGRYLPCYLSGTLTQYSCDF